MDVSERSANNQATSKTCNVQKNLEVTASAEKAMHREYSYKKHLDFMSTAIDMDEIDCYTIEEQYQNLLNALPNEGKLYKYRSLCGQSFSYIYDGLKNGYLWMPSADKLNDDFDSIVFGDPILQYRTVVDCIFKDSDKLLYFLCKKYGENIWQKNRLLSKIPFSDFLCCFDPNTYALSDLVTFLNSSFDDDDDKLDALDEIKTIFKDLMSMIPRAETFIKWASERNNLIYKITHVFSMSENYDLDNMWGYYADSGKGFCIEYDFSRAKNLSIDDKKFLLNMFRVNYENEHLSFDIESLFEKFFFENDSEEFVFKIGLGMINQVTSKSKCWEHEKEWRITVAKCDAKIYINIVSGIIIDERSLVKNNAKKLIHLCKRNGWDIKVRLRSHIDEKHFYLPYDEYQRHQKSIRNL